MMAGGMGGVMMVIGLLFWALIIAGVVLLILWLVQKGGGLRNIKDDETPLQILEKRYARGEITRAQFEEMKNDLVMKKNN